MENVKEKQKWPMGPLCAPCVEYFWETLELFPDPPVLCRQNAHDPHPLIVEVLESYPKTCSNCGAHLSDLGFSYGN